MCEYCKEPTKTIKWHRQDTDTNIAECFIHGASDGYAMFLRQGLKTDITDDFKLKINQMNEYAYIDINYCPFCGKKLGKTGEIENGKSNMPNWGLFRTKKRKSENPQPLEYK